VISDLGALLALRIATVPRARLLLSAAAVTTVLALVGVVAAALRARTLPGGRTDELRVLLPTLFLTFAVTVVVAAVTSGGGREVIARAEALAFPVSADVDHLGALVLAPVNLAWLLQGAALVFVTAYVLPLGSPVWPALVVVAAWQVAATVLAQLLSGAAEWVRTLPRGRWWLRAAAAVAVALVVLTVLTHRWRQVLSAAPARPWAHAALAGHDGSWGQWALGTAELLLVSVIGFWLGLKVARALARRPRPEEARAESRSWRRGTDPSSDLLGLLRTDLAGVWRSVPLRRGALVLGVLPALVAGAGRVPWETMTVLPALVASGAALLFGVNAWCLDGPGAWWRESQPVAPGTLLLARALALTLTVVAPLLLTLAIAVARAPTSPTPAQVAALALCSLVVCVHVLTRCLWWSVTRPHAADLRSARATPAPPVSMAAYSAQLALVTTVLGVTFGICGTYGRIDLAAVVSVLVLATSGRRLWLVRRRWDDPVARSRVVATVARS
jgi:hypothetical protein